VNGIQARFSKEQVIRFYYAFNRGGPELRVARVIETFPGPSTTRNVLCYDYTVNGVRSFRDYGMTGIRGLRSDPTHVARVGLTQGGSLGALT
jgi:hypothetical protein